MNERNEFLMTTFPVADVNQAAPSPVVFPQIADGGGYVTEIILLSSGQAASTTLNYYDENGMPTNFGLNSKQSGSRTNVEKAIFPSTSSISLDSNVGHGNRRTGSRGKLFVAFTPATSPKAAQMLF